VRRVLALFVLILALAPGTWLRSALPVRSKVPDMQLVALPMPPARALAPFLGPFRLEGIWLMTGTYAYFGGYSALLRDGAGHFTAFSDRGTFLHFAMPGQPPFPPIVGETVDAAGNQDDNFDTEAVTSDPATGTVWTAWETTNLVIRHDAQGRETGRVKPPAMAHWPVNKGAEAIVRLADGRFVFLCECFEDWSRAIHPSLLFAGDPVADSRAASFRFAAVPEFRPVDMAQLPDGRVLVLLRRLVWPMPPRFAGALAIADPARIVPGQVWRARPVAWLASSLPIDNFEGMAIEPRPDGRIDVWLIADDNSAVTQRTLLWKLAVDPADLS